MTCEHGATPCTRLYPSRWPDDARGHWCFPAGDLECSPVLEAERARVVAWLRRIASTGSPAERDVVVILADSIERGDHTG